MLLAGVPAAIIASPMFAQIPNWGFDGHPPCDGAVLRHLRPDRPQRRRPLREATCGTPSRHRPRPSSTSAPKSPGGSSCSSAANVDVEYDGVQVLFDVDFDAGRGRDRRASRNQRRRQVDAAARDQRHRTRRPAARSSSTAATSRTSRRYEIADRGVVHMPGGRGIFPGLSVRENLALGTLDAASEQDERRTTRAPQGAGPRRRSSRSSPSSRRDSTSARRRAVRR